MSDDERRKLVSTEQSLGMPAAEPRMPSSIAGLETFSLSDDDEKEAALPDAESLFNLPAGGDDDDEEDDADRGGRR
jgi:hypothetical protein